MIWTEPVELGNWRSEAAMEEEETEEAVDVARLATLDTAVAAPAVAVSSDMSSNGELVFIISGSLLN